MKRNTILLITCIFASIHAIALCFLGMVFLQWSIFSLLPMILLWVGYAKTQKTCVLISAIIYCIFAIGYGTTTIIIFNIPMIVLSFISFAKMVKGETDGKTKETA